MSVHLPKRHGSRLCTVGPLPAPTGLTTISAAGSRSPPRSSTTSDNQYRDTISPSYTPLLFHPTGTLRFSLRRQRRTQQRAASGQVDASRSEERRVGKERITDERAPTEASRKPALHGGSPASANWPDDDLGRRFTFTTSQLDHQRQPIPRHHFTVVHTTALPPDRNTSFLAATTTANPTTSGLWPGGRF